MATVDLTSLDNTIEDGKHRAPLVLGGMNYSDVTDAVAGVWEKKQPAIWWPIFGLSVSLTLLFGALIMHLFFKGVGVWGNNNPTYWAFDIVNFVFWVGIGHAGTLISAILFLFRQHWRTSINRAAEAMTTFAVICAATFPGIHIGRIWVFYWLFPVPTEHLAMWPNFRSPLLWDVFAVSTYFTVSVLFWYTGLVPDLATLRDRATNKLRKFFYGIAALGWRGGNRQWKHYEMAYLILAGLSTPLVLSVHSVVSFDFATSVIPGWHTTIFPPYFVAGAIFGGFAMVLTIMLPARAIFGLHDLITDDHVDKMCKIILLTGSIVGYAYAMEFFIAWYGGNAFEQYAFINRATGPYWWAYWAMIFCNVVTPQLFWFRFFRRHVLWVFVVCMFVNAGMWFERFVIIVTSLHRDFLPSSWNMFYPTWVDIWTFVGTFGIFLALFLLFIRWLPMICIFEVKAVLPEADPHHGHDDHHHEPATAVKGGAH